ncbi:hypothetical protein ASD51_21470 [Streptomyces sp. Root55]|nr:hypothetical protein ASD51_21470 [Streptomyces sp. Root55]
MADRRGWTAQEFVVDVSGGTSANSRAPAPSVNGAWYTRGSSTRSAATYCLTVVASPWIRTSPSPADRLARAGTDAVPSVTT